MTSALPTNDFRWLDESARFPFVQMLQRGKLPHLSGRGFIVEVDIQPPEEYKDLLSEFPLAPENRVVESNELSDIQLEQFTSIYKKPPQKAGSNPKLIADLNSKNKYIIHHQYLKFLLEMKYTVKAVYRIMTFNESDFMKKYIKTCTESRAEARARGDEADADFWKLSANAVYGKFIENVRQYRTFKLCVGSAQKQQVYTSSPLWNSSHYVNANTSVEELLPEVIMFNKALAVGLAILDLSKVHMARFYYQVLKNVWGSRCKVVYTDTDSFILKLFTNGEFFIKNQIKDLTIF